MWRPTERNVIPLKFVAATTITCPIFQSSAYCLSFTRCAAWLRTSTNLPEILYTARRKRREREREQKEEQNEKQAPTTQNSTLSQIDFRVSMATNGPGWPGDFRSDQCRSRRANIARGEKKVQSCLSVSLSLSHSVSGVLVVASPASVLILRLSRIGSCCGLIMSVTSQINFSDVTVGVATVCFACVPIYTAAAQQAAVLCAGLWRSVQTTEV